MSMPLQPAGGRSLDIAVRPLRKNDLSAADHVMWLAFGAFPGLPEPTAFMGDANDVRTRWRANPAAAFGATADGEFVGSSFATRWGSVGFLGPLTIHPDWWDRGVGQQLMKPVVDCFDQWGTRYAGLFTFAHSQKHVGLSVVDGSAFRQRGCQPSRQLRGKIMSTHRALMIGTIFMVFAASAQQALADPVAKFVDRGRYLVKITGCNDCHTPGYAQAGGKIPEKEWLVGDRLGWRGPWGTTYPANLRLYMHKLSENQWVKIAHTAQFRPPMPWFALHDMKEQDLRALYQFIKYLGPAGEPAPAYLSPDQTPSEAHVLFPGPPP